MIYVADGYLLNRNEQPWIRKLLFALANRFLIMSLYQKFSKAEAVKGQETIYQLQLD